MSSEDEIIDSDLVSIEEGDDGDFEQGSDAQANGIGEDEEGSYMNGMGDDEDNTQKRRRGNKDDEDDLDEDDDEADNNVNGKMDEKEEGRILEKLKNERITHQKFFNFLSVDIVKGKQAILNEEEDDEDQANQQDDEDEGNYIVKIDNDKEEEIDHEKQKSVQKGRQDFLELINELKSSVVEAKQKFLPILANLKNKNVDLKEGMSYMDAKFHLLNQYCSSLAFYVLAKVQGQSIKGHPLLNRLIYIKTLISKLKPLDKKLEYQISKLLRLANEETLIGQSYMKKTETEDPLALKPRPETMSKTLTMEDIDVTEEGNIVEKRKGLYRAPKMHATLMEEERKANKRVSEEDKKRKRMLKGEIFKQIQEEYGDEPVEIKNLDRVEEVEDEEEKARTAYEEKYFLRLPRTKEDKKKLKEKQKKVQQGERLDDFSELEKFSEFFKQEAKQKQRVEDEKDSRMKKSLAEFLAKRKNEKIQDGDNEGDFDDFGDGEGKEFFGGRKKVKQDQGRFQNKKPQGGAGNRGFMGNRGGRGQRRGGGFNRGGRRMGNKKF